MLSFIAVVAFALSLAAPLRAQTLPFVEPLTPVRVFEFTERHEGVWIEQRDTVLVLQQEGIRRSYAVGSIDSIFVYTHSASTIKKAGMTGALVGGASFALFAAGICEFECTTGLIAAGVGGAALGALVGATIGRLISLGSDTWVAIYRRH